MLALVGGDEWRDGCTFDAELLEASGGAEVLVLPTAAAFEHPERAVDTARQWFAGLGGEVRPLMVLRRADAMDAESAATVRAARFVYLSGGSPLHLRSVLKDSLLWDALVHAWSEGAVVAGSSAGAMTLCDPMVDPRGGAFTVGLGLVTQLAVVAHRTTWSEDKLRRAIELAGSGIPVVAIDERTALIRGADGSWKMQGSGTVAVFLDGEPAGLDALPH